MPLETNPIHWREAARLKSSIVFEPHTLRADYYYNGDPRSGWALYCRDVHQGYWHTITEPEQPPQEGLEPVLKPSGWFWSEAKLTPRIDPTP